MVLGCLWANAVDGAAAQARVQSSDLHLFFGDAEPLLFKEWEPIRGDCPKGNNSHERDMPSSAVF